MYDFTYLSIVAKNTAECFAAELFNKELKKRTGKAFPVTENYSECYIELRITDTLPNKDCYKICHTDKHITVYALTVRGLIYGYSHFLRKTEFNGENITLIECINGEYIPQKQLRGHQTGYRTTPNTYDAWDYDTYFQYYLDMMAFGANICEHNGTKPSKNARNCLMKYEQYEFLEEASRLAQLIDLDISVWHANDDNESEEDAVIMREKLYQKVPHIQFFFPPGGDPGELPADVFVDRCKKISRSLKKIHPDIKMHPSAQAPHSMPSWGKDFIDALQDEPDEIDAVIMGPNHAYPMHELRKKVPQKYPLRFYPDITHNLRCEYPVNFLNDDWHFAFEATLSRESVNPRPTELRTLHRLFSPYTVGSVSYSEGVHDDLNKAVWSALEFDANSDLREIITDYARYFIYGAPAEKFADCILLLERNWQGAPEENPCIDLAYKELCSLKRDYPHLKENWRFMLHYFRGCCDMLVKMRRVFELSLCKNAKRELEKGNTETALGILNTPFDSTYVSLRKELDALGELLFNLIGIQLDVEHYHTDSWERGATLDTIDNNVTDRSFLIKKCEYALTLPQGDRERFINKLLNLRTQKPEEVYFSVALHGLVSLGVPQNGEFYMDIQGDRPSAKEKSLPMAMTKVYDHFSFNAHFGTFQKDTDYELIIAYQHSQNDAIEHHKITANGVVIYDGKRYGGTEDQQFDAEFLAEGFSSRKYRLPKEVFQNGALDLEITEPVDGFKLCELWIKKVRFEPHMV